MSWIKARRKELRITQDDLASRLQVMGVDISRATVSHWEMGRYQPSYDKPEVTRALARALNLSEPIVLKLAGFEVETKHSESAERIAKLIDDLPTEKRQLAIRLLEELARA